MKAQAKVRGHNPPTVTSGALWGPPGNNSSRYRYRLWRVWEEGKRVLFIMLNPSTADAEKDDPTVHRCGSYARAWGFGSLEVVNLFALRSTDPKALRTHDVPTGEGNGFHIRQAAREAQLIVCAWGCHGDFLGQGEFIRTFLQANGHKLHVFGLTKGGFPKHPLYLKADLMPVEWK